MSHSYKSKIAVVAQHLMTTSILADIYQILTPENGVFVPAAMQACFTFEPYLAPTLRGSVSRELHRCNLHYS